MPENIVVVDIPDEAGQIADDSEAIGRNAVRLALANLVASSTFGRKKIDDPDLADEVILRLNRMANNPKNRDSIRKWYVDNNSWLNSIVGFIREGEFSGCGYVTMTSDEEGAFTGFERVDRVMQDASQLRHKIDRTPTTLEEAVIALGKLLIQEDHREMVHGARSVAEVCADLHHSLGRHLRNEWGLWKDSLLARHFKEVHGIEHPDDMSHLIIETYCKQNIPTVWERLKEET